MMNVNKLRYVGTLFAAMIFALIALPAPTHADNPSTTAPPAPSSAAKLPADAAPGSGAEPDSAAIVIPPPPAVIDGGPWAKLIVESDDPHRLLDTDGDVPPTSPILPLEFHGKVALGQPADVFRLTMSQWLANCYVLVGAHRQTIVIDPADWLKPLPDNHWGLTGADSGQLVEFLHKHHLDVRYIVSTHGHLDHVSGDTAVQAAYPHCVICMGAGDIDANGRPKDSHMFPGGLPKVNRILRDGDVVRCGGISLKVLITPGHSPGSLSFVCGNWVFTGDTLFWHTVGRTNFNDGSGNWNEEMKSIRTKLYRLPSATLVLPGHLQFTTIGEEKANNPFTRDSAPDPTAALPGF